VHSDTGSPASRTAFPPRDQLPRDVAIEKLSVLGTTWYERGPDYWVRRFWLFLLMVLVVGLMSLIVGGFLNGIRGSSHTGFVGALIVEIVWSLVIIGYMMIKTAQRWNNLEPSRPLSRRQRGAGAAGGAVGVLATTGIFIAQFVLVIGSVLFFGLYVSLLIYALLPEWPPEHKARLRLAAQLASQPLPPSSPTSPIALGP
jgi:vacuolar-type H+-ATPase subunit I/STV1